MKTITHIYAAIAAAVGAFLVTPAGQSVLMQYPKLASIIGAIAVIAGVYHSPKTT